MRPRFGGEVVVAVKEEQDRGESPRPDPGFNFASVMDELGPWNETRRVAVGVSGGPDSLALAYLLARWGRPTAFIVDHGLRPESTAEARLTADRLATIGVPARILTLLLTPGPALAARARLARHDTLAAAAAAADLVDLLLGHHRGDQAETLLMRADAGSGPAGLAAMPAIHERTAIRLVRPLLDATPLELRAILRSAGLGWIDDPSNRDRHAARTRLRQNLSDPQGTGPEIAALAAAARMHGQARADTDVETANFLARYATIRPEGFAILQPCHIDSKALGALIQALTGAPYAPPTAMLNAFARAPRPATLAGIRVMPAGRFGPGLLFAREPAAMEPSIPAQPGALWDRRFRIDPDAVLPEGATIGATTGSRNLTDLPVAVRATMPAIRHRGALLDVRTWFSPATPAAGAPYKVSRGESPPPDPGAL